MLGNATAQDVGILPHHLDALGIPAALLDAAGCIVEANRTLEILIGARSDRAGRRRAQGEAESRRNCDQRV